MRIGIIGAGFAGLSTAKIMKELGHEVVLVDQAPDIGGVWSRTRRYPGLTTQNTRDTYAFSDFPMPSDYPQFPTGAQVQSYLESYAKHFGLLADLRLQTRVERADLNEQTKTWTLELTEIDGRGQRTTETVDHLAVCNGIFSDPYVPELLGREDHLGAGGRLCHASQPIDLEDARGRHVVVIGYGKSACDVAVALSDVAASTTVVARQLIWKMPKRVAGLGYQHLLLTRMGEALFRYLRPTPVERLLHGPGRPVRNGLLGAVQSVITRQMRLRELGLLPDGPLERIARSTVSLATDGFVDRVRAQTIVVRRETEIVRLLGSSGGPAAELDDGQVIPADLVVCGTGYRQRVPFLSSDVLTRVLDDRGNFALYRQILPHDVPGLSFHGYNSSFFSPLSAEIGALWTADLIGGGRTVPAEDERRAQVAERLHWMEQRTEGGHARGTNIIPFSLHNIDEMLCDLGVGVSIPTRAIQWLRPVSPASFRPAIETVLDRHRRRTGDAAARREERAEALAA